MAIGFTPRHSETIELGSYNQQQSLALALETAKLVGWKIGYLSTSGFIAYTDNGIMKSNSQIKFRIEGQIATIESESLGSEMIDFGKNKKIINEFNTFLNRVKNEITEEQLKLTYDKLSFVEQEKDILFLPPQTTKEKFFEIISIFIPKEGYFITPILIDLNIIIFAIMVLSGVNFMSPDSESLISWGANFRPSTLDNQWWRIITSCFLHIGIIHLLLNMYALLYIGSILEPLLGKWRFLTAYLLTGISASTTSLWWHDLTVSAGASGAIFGMYGVFLAMLTTNFIEKESRKSLLSSIGVFVGYNLIFGLQGGIDNSAHIGGLLSGIIIGYSFYFSLIKPDSKKISIITSSILTILIIVSSVLVCQNISNDVGIYQEKMNQFSELETKALEIYNTPDSLSNEQSLLFLKKTGIPNWKKCISITNEVCKLDLPDEYQHKIFILRKYSDLRLKSYVLIEKAITENTNNYYKEIEQLNKEIEDVIKQLNIS